MTEPSITIEVNPATLPADPDGETWDQCPEVRP